ncbi:hypothetical protein [Azohydromonas australica]|uniref:hypothetical protein n=1 Tax=Azohydromonas australica TaxID=364039 RepID=UPI0004116660|nr:hypothetical protein [Azohydromonas australica]
MDDQHEETPLQRVQRRVIEAEAQVAAQVAWIAEMDRMNYSTVDEEIALAVLKDKLRLFQDEVARELQRSDASRRR